MEYHEARSVKEIREYISTQRYSKKSQIRDHMEYLEHLANKIADRLEGEKEMGEVGWQEKTDLQKVHSIYAELNSLLDARERAKMGTQSKSKGLF